MESVTNDPEPYVGPQPFESKDKDKFFGRVAEATQLEACIAAHSEVLLYAQSGAGKTSLINASLIPRLSSYEVLRARVHGPELDARVADSIRNIYAYHAIAAWSEGALKPEEIAPLTMAEYLARRPAVLDEDGDLRRRLLVFDQFEELFVFYPGRWKERGDFFKQLRDALNNQPSLCVLLAMREDRAPEVDAYSSLLPERLRTRFRLERLRRESALQAVTKPLQPPYSFAPGVARSVLDQLLKIEVKLPSGEIDVSEGEFVEPVQLQLVCRTLWNGLEEGETTIDQRHVERCGDVDAALQLYYEEAITAAVGLGMDEPQLRKWFADKLITPVGTRSLVYQGSTDTGGLPNNIVELLDRMHVIRSEIRGTDTWYELAHDRFLAPIRESNDAWWARRNQLERDSRAKADPTDRATVVLDTESGSTLEHDPSADQGTALCLSGGGCRSMLFQVGVLWRLNELGRFQTVDRCCAVSAAAITAAQLARVWTEFKFGNNGAALNFEPLVVAPLRRLAVAGFKISAIFAALRLGTNTITERLKRDLFGGATLGDLPERPKFVFNATNLVSGGIWSFSKHYMGDPLIGKQRDPDLPLAEAVTACLSLPVVTRYHLALDPSQFKVPPSILPPDEHGLLQLALSDGGFADPMALESAWNKHRTILVSDGTAWDPMTGQMTHQASSLDWAAMAGRLIDIVQHRTRSVRKHQIIDSLKLGAKDGAYWGIQADIESFGLASALPCPPERTLELLRLPTNFKPVSSDLQERLINWGYAVCDAAMRKHLAGTVDAQPAFPYPSAGV